MKDNILENRGLIGKIEYLQLSMQITSNVVEMQDFIRCRRSGSVSDGHLNQSGA